MISELIVTGHVPGKKNLLRPRKRVGKDGRAFYYDKDVKQRLNEIEFEIERQWGSRPPLISPAIAFLFYVQTGRSDRDNKTTTVLDAMVAAGVLKDDSIAECNGEVLIGKAYQAKHNQAGVRIFIEPSGDFDALWQHIKDLTPEDFSFDYKKGFSR